MGKRINTVRCDKENRRCRIHVHKNQIHRNSKHKSKKANVKAICQVSDTGNRKKISVLYAQFIETKKDSTSQSHWKGVVSRWRNYIEPYIAEMEIRKVNENDLQNIINKAYSNRNLAAKTLKNIRADLIAFIKFCRKERVTTLMPESLTIPASAKRPKKCIVQPQDLVKLFSIDTTLYRGKRTQEPYIHAFRLEVLTGLRPGEINGLEWIDIVGHDIRLKQAKNVFGEITQGKNENAVRRVPLSELACMEIEAQRNLTGDQVSVFNISCLQTYYKHWLRYLESNGMEKTTPYELRHTFVSIVKKLPEGLVKSLVGHSRSMDTYGIYGHEIEGEAEEIAQRVNCLFTTILSYQTK